VNLEEMEFAIDGIDEADALSEEMKGADAAVADAVNAIGDFIVDVAGGEDRPITADRTARTWNFSTWRRRK